MPRIPSITEQQLNRLSPRELDEEYLSRLTACADGSLLEQTGEEIELEQHLRDQRPKGISSGFNESLLEIIGDTPFAVDEKIVLFNRSSAKGQSTGGSKRDRFSPVNVAAAAAVALLGSVAALMIPAGGGNETITENEKITRDAIAGPAVAAPVVSSEFVPRSFNRNLRDTWDDGVSWQKNKFPHRVYRFPYTDRLILENEKGDTVELEQQWEDITIIPEKMD